MVLKLYGHNISAYTKLVALVLIEKQVPFEYHQLNLRDGEHRTGEHAGKHPFKYVPYIDDDGFILYESRAIAYYLATKYASQGTPLIPTDLHELALMHQALAVEGAYFNDSAEKLLFEAIINPIKGIATRPQVKEELINKLTTRLAVYDAILENQKYIAGDKFTLADLIHIPVGSTLPACGTDAMQTRPNVNRWFQEISSRPSWTALSEGVPPVMLSY